MRDLVAGIVALLLLLVALSLATTLRAYRRRRQRARDSERALGRTVIAELPTGDDLVLVSEDEHRFYYGERAIDKDLIAAVRLLINGAPIAAYESRRDGTNTSVFMTTPERGVGARAKPDSGAEAPGVIEVRPDGIARDRWDVAVETAAGTVLIECGAIRERVSQELARAVFEAVRTDMEERDGRI